MRAILRHAQSVVVQRGELVPPHRGRRHPPPARAPSAACAPALRKHPYPEPVEGSDVQRERCCDRSVRPPRAPYQSQSRDCVVLRHAVTLRLADAHLIQGRGVRALEARTAQDCAPAGRSAHRSGFHPQLAPPRTRMTTSPAFYSPQRAVRLARPRTVRTRQPYDECNQSP